MIKFGQKYLFILGIGLKMTVIFLDFLQNLCDHMPEKSDSIAHNGKQNLLVVAFDQIYWSSYRVTWLLPCLYAEIHPWCNTCWPLDGQHLSGAFLINVPVHMYMHKHCWDSNLGSNVWHSAHSNRMGHTSSAFIWYLNNKIAWHSVLQKLNPLHRLFCLLISYSLVTLPFEETNNL